MCLQEIITRNRIERGWQRRGREKLLPPFSFCVKRWLQTCKRATYLKICLCSRELKPAAEILLSCPPFQQTQFKDKQKGCNVYKYTYYFLQPRPIISMKWIWAFSAGNKEKGNRLSSQSLLNSSFLSVSFKNNFPSLRILLCICYSLHHTIFHFLLLLNSDSSSLFLNLCLPAEELFF